MIRCRILALAAVTLLLMQPFLSGCASNPKVPKSAPQYRLQVLAFPAMGINDKGEMFGIVGSGRTNPSSQLPDRETEHLAVWQNGKKRDLGMIAGTDWCQPTAINDLGEVIGTFGPCAMGPGNTEPEQYHLFLWNGKILADLTTTGEAVGINNGQVVGQKTWPDGQHGFLYTGGKTLKVKNPLSSRYSEVRAINDKGQMVGIAAGPSIRNDTEPIGTVHAMFWNDGIPSEMHLPNHSGFSIGGGPIAINNSGQVIINANDLDEPGAQSGLGVESRCYIWQNGVVTDLGVLPGFSMSAVAINDQGQVIGNAMMTGGFPQSNVTRPFLWQSGTLYDLNSLASRKGWTMTHVSGFNNRGQIIGSGEGNHKVYGFLLTPIK